MSKPFVIGEGLHGSVTRVWEKPRETNGQLEAAAPELLEALKLCEENISSLLASAHPRVFGVWLEVVRAAISKAEGGAL